MVGHVDVHRPESSDELFEIDQLVAVLIEPLQQVDCVALQVREVASWGCNLPDDGVHGGFGEHIGVVFHVLFGVLVAAGQHELETGKVHTAADHEVPFSVVVVVDRVLLLLALHEAATDTAAVFVADFVDLDGVVTAVEADDEGAGLIVRVSGDQSGVEAKDVHVLLEHLLHVELWRLGLQGEHASHRVFFGAVASVGGYGLVEYVWCLLLERDGDLSVVLVALVPLSSEVVDVIDKALAAPNRNGLTTLQISGSVVVNFTHVHAWAVGENGQLG